MAEGVFDPFEGPLVDGVLVRRYKRFLADVHLDDGRQVTVHCPNPGSMLGMAEAGMEVAVRHVDDPRRKLAWTWELVRPAPDSGWVGVNTMRANAIAEWAIGQGAVPGVEGTVRREVPVGASRLDMVVGEPPAYVEVKNTTLARDGLALFPDSVTARGRRHMEELAGIAESGGEAGVLFLVNRGDCDAFAVAEDIDPHYAAALHAARDAGVQAWPLAVHPSPEGWRLGDLLPLQ